MAIEVRDLSFSYGSSAVLHDISFCAEGGEMIALLGANGVGKTTLFRCLLGFLTPTAGEILIDSKSVADYPPRELARRIAYIPQSYSPAFNYTVFDTVLMGVTGRLGTFGAPGAAQREQVMRSLSALGIDRLADRGSRKISGGERQLMLIARALVQDAKILLMDEPTASLDYGNAFRVMEKLEHLAASGYTVLFSTHDPNQVLRHAKRVLALKDGTILAEGESAAVLNEQTLSALYGIGVAVRSVRVGDKEDRVSIPY